MREDGIRRWLFGAARRVPAAAAVLTGLYLYGIAIISDLGNWGNDPDAAATRHEAWTHYLIGSAVILTAAGLAWIGRRPVWVAGPTAAPGLLVGIPTLISGPDHYDTPVQLCALLAAYLLGLTATIAILAIPDRRPRPS